MAALYVGTGPTCFSTVVARLLVLDTRVISDRETRLVLKQVTQIAPLDLCVVAAVSRFVLQVEPKGEVQPREGSGRQVPGAGDRRSQRRTAPQFTGKRARQGRRQDDQQVSYYTLPALLHVL